MFSKVKVSILDSLEESSSIIEEFEFELEVVFPIKKEGPITINLNKLWEELSPYLVRRLLLMGHCVTHVSLVSDKTWKDKLKEVSL